jgi:peptidylprolyl isomerase
MAPRSLILGALAVLALALGVAGCGDDDKGSDTAASTSAATTPSTPPADTSAAEPATATKPKVTCPKGAPPKKLVSKDIKTGSGQAAKAGDTVSVQYVGVNYKDCKEFDASWDRGEPFQFQLGAGMVIPGWDQGVVGMKPGGRRELIIPPDLAYGAEGSPPAIPPNSTLIFVIDLQSIG